MRTFLLCLALTACGGGSDAGDLPLTKAELESEIQAEAGRIDSCDVVEDCEARAYGCHSVYVSSAADQSQLDDLVMEYESRFGGMGCDASCQCGVLRCEEHKCTTSSGDCMTTPPDGMMICL